jgi:ribonucleotide monophosphatase NagD (HAD superfamily)
MPIFEPGLEDLVAGRVSDGSNPLVAAISSVRQGATILQYGLIPLRGSIRNAQGELSGSDLSWSMTGPGGLTRTGTGPILAALEYATGRTARVLGKPSPEFFTAPLDALGRGAQSALVVGDDLAADIGGGHAVGAATVLVRSGKGDRPQPGAGAEPDAVVDSVADLPGLLQG